MTENDTLFPMADSQDRLVCKEIWGESRAKIWRSLPGVLLDLSIRHPAAGALKVVTFIILAFARTAQYHAWLSQMLPGMVKLYRKSASMSMMR